MDPRLDMILGDDNKILHLLLDFTTNSGRNAFFGYLSSKGYKISYPEFNQLIQSLDTIKKDVETNIK